MKMWKVYTRQIKTLQTDGRQTLIRKVLLSPDELMQYKWLKTNIKLSDKNLFYVKERFIYLWEIIFSVCNWC